MIKHINIKVYGKVQGVWFRRSTLENAVSIGVCGFVRNEADGTVYIEAEAGEETLQEFIFWCRQGPKAAEVLKLEITESSVLDFQEFKIR